MRQTQRGFTLVEIAIVLVIIGLLLGGILKGQELINSARVRNIADANSGIQAAYFGFIDRYRAVPGDMDLTAASAAIGQTMNAGGNANGRLDAVAPATPYGESAALWEHLWKGGFLQGSYDGLVGGATVPDVTTYPQVAPKNPFNGAIILFRTKDYMELVGTTPQAAASVRLNQALGQNIPVGIARELDVKIDDARPYTGVLRITPVAATGTFGTLTQSLATCVATAPANDYNIAGDAQDCGVTYLY